MQSVALTHGLCCRTDDDQDFNTHLGVVDLSLPGMQRSLQLLCYLWQVSKASYAAVQHRLESLSFTISISYHLFGTLQSCHLQIFEPV